MHILVATAALQRLPDPGVARYISMSRRTVRGWLEPVSPRMDYPPQPGETR